MTENSGTASCPHCGARFPAGGSFCPVCGQPSDAPPAPAPTPPSAPVPAQVAQAQGHSIAPPPPPGPYYPQPQPQPQPQPYGPVPGYSAGYGDAPPPARRNRMPVVIGLGLVGLVLVVGARAVCSSQPLGSTPRHRLLRSPSLRLPPCLAPVRRPRPRLQPSPRACLPIRWLARSAPPVR